MTGDWWQWLIAGVVVAWAVWRLIRLFTHKPDKTDHCATGPCAGCTLADTCRKKPNETR